MSYLDKIRTTVKQRGEALMLYGPPGVGKTEFCANMPRPLFVVHKKEQGINDLKKAGKVDPSIPVIEYDSWDELLGIFKELQGTTDYDWIINDSLTWSEQCCFHECCKKEYNNDFSKDGFFAYQSGPNNAASKYWPDFLEAVEDVCLSGVNVCLIAHCTVKPFRNPVGASYDVYMPRLHTYTFELLQIWAENLICMLPYISSRKEGGRSKATDIVGRYMYCSDQPGFAAKSKSLPDEIDMGHSGEEAWNNYLKAREEYLSKAKYKPIKSTDTPPSSQPTVKRKPVLRRKLK